MIDKVINILLEMDGLIFTFAGFFASLLLLLTYYTKKRFNSAKNRLFRLMLVFCLILSITDILSFLSLKLLPIQTLINIIYKLDWLVRLIWYAFYYYYIMCFLYSINGNNLFKLIKENKGLKIFTIFFLVASVIYAFIPVSNLDSNYVIWLPLYISYYVILIVCIIDFLIIISIITNSNYNQKGKKIIVIMVIELFLFILFQFLIPQISFAPVAFVIHTYMLYFIIENPDLKVINEVEKLKDDIEKASNSKTDFLSNMSHEIRSPMNAIVGISEELKALEVYDEQKVKDDIKSIHNAGNNLLEIINNILDISKIETGTEELYPREYNIYNVLTELSSIIDARLSKKDVELILDIDKNTPCKLYGDQTKIYQILLNILSNSVKYTEVGKIKLTVNSELKETNAILHFKISDTGYGIKKEDFDKMFEKFSRLDSAISNEIEGTGLGLVITKKYVDLMGGRIWFDSEYQVGTNFYVDISQRIIDPTPVGSVLNRENQTQSISFLDCSLYNILVVDDNKLNIKVATRIFEKYKFNIDTATSGEECINKVKFGNKYDMIFLDHMMPELDGIQTLHILKKLGDFKIPPVVALTANAITGMKDMYLNEGFDEYLSKPINITELDKIINKYFKK